MKFLLDTDHISILQKQSGAEFTRLIARIAQVPRADLAFCIISFHEQVLGCHTRTLLAPSCLRISFVATKCWIECYQRSPLPWSCLSMQTPPTYLPA
jgi:hypothetical protein